MKSSGGVTGWSSQHSQLHQIFGKQHYYKGIYPQSSKLLAWGGISLRLVFVQKYDSFKIIKKLKILKKKWSLFANLVTNANGTIATQ